MGMSPYSIYSHQGIPATQCLPFDALRKYHRGLTHLGIKHCEGEALKGTERVLLWATSVLSASERPTIRTLPGYPHPTKLNVAVVGHFQHEGLTPREEEES